MKTQNTLYVLTINSQIVNSGKKLPVFSSIEDAEKARDKMPKKLREDITIQTYQASGIIRPALRYIENF